MLQDTNFRRALLRFDKDAIAAEQIAQVEEILATEKAVFAGEAMARISKAGHVLLQWVKAIVTYYHVAKALALQAEEFQSAKFAPRGEEHARATFSEQPATGSTDAELAGIQAAAALADEILGASPDAAALPLLPPVRAALEALLGEVTLQGLRLATLEPVLLDGAALRSAAWFAEQRSFALAALGHSRPTAFVADWLTRVLRFRGFAVGREAAAACDSASNLSADSWTQV